MNTTGWIDVGFLGAVTVGLLGHWRRTVGRHQRRLDQLQVRVHVNGIRGKSTVTRLVAGVLREGGFVTVGKTTGSAARVISPSGAETPIFRRGAPTINEQVDIVAKHVVTTVEALVIECMAVRPAYQQYSQDYIVRSDITIITNVREDHQEEMGETLEEIADSMSVTIPYGGLLITSEDRPHLVERLAQRASERGARMVRATVDSVHDDDLRGFDYLQFKENVAIGFAIARELGIDRSVALRGMHKSVPDVGVVRLRTYPVAGKRVMWVPMFAANDRESVMLTFQTLSAQFPRGAARIGILNNRADRGRRAELFAHMVPDDLAPYLDDVITFGAYEDSVVPTMIDRGYPADRIHKLGDTVNPSLDEILEVVARLIPGQHGVLIGMVNIHTDQAEMLIEHFTEADGVHAVDELAESRLPQRQPRGVSRLASHGRRKTGG